MRKYFHMQYFHSILLPVREHSSRVRYQLDVFIWLSQCLSPLMNSRDAVLSDLSLHFLGFAVQLVLHGFNRFSTMEAVEG